jgi:SAM-dependent methyltransferase
MTARLMRSNTVRIGTPRWVKAQAYEQAYWQRLGDDIETGVRGRLDWYAWRAEQLEKRLDSIHVSNKEGKVLEIGSGPIGIVNFLRGGERYAVDPLEHFYCTRPTLVGLRNPDVRYQSGTGEDLSFENESCSLVIIDNVLDHTYEPGRILKQVERILRPDGCLYLAVNVHTVLGALLHTALAVLQIDKGHPYTFTSGRLRRFVGGHGFEVMHEQIEDYEAAKRENRRSKELTDRIKGYTGLSEFAHSMVCCKKAAAKRRLA